MPTFSERNDLRTTNIPIVVRNEALNDFRKWVVDLAQRKGLSIDTILQVIYQKTYQSGEDDNWGDDNKRREAYDKLQNAQWYYVYDVVESLVMRLNTDNKKSEFTQEVNTYFHTHGYGWKLENGQILFRGETIEGRAYTNAMHALSSQPTAQNELKLALEDLSKRPQADTTGSVHHSMAALECYCRQKMGNTTSTLGDVIKHNRAMFTSPLDQVLEKMWGFASNHGRHVQNGCSATVEEAELVLNISASMIAYLSKVLP